MTRTNQKYIATTCFIVGLILCTTEWFLIGIGMTAWSGYWFLQYNFQQRNNRAITSALSKLDVIRGGIRFVGTECESISIRRAGDYRNSRSNTLFFEQLCKSKKGTWFRLTFATVNGTGVPFDFQVFDCNEQEAMTWLQSNQDLYKKYFGEPRLA